MFINQALRPQVFAVGIVVFLLGGCSRTIVEPSDADDSQEEGDEAACADGSCPEELYCGPDRVLCEGGLGIRPCIDGNCGPAPRLCVAERSRLDTCEQACGNSEMNCVAGGCEGSTAFGFKGPEWDGGELCGIGGDSYRDQWQALEIGCGEPLPFGELSVFQCCCDDPAE